MEIELDLLQPQRCHDIGARRDWLKDGGREGVTDDGGGKKDGGSNRIFFWVFFFFYYFFVFSLTFWVSILFFSTNFC